MSISNLALKMQNKIPDRIRKKMKNRLFLEFGVTALTA